MDEWIGRKTSSSLVKRKLFWWENIFCLSPQMLLWVLKRKKNFILIHIIRTWKMCERHCSHFFPPFFMTTNVNSHAWNIFLHHYFYSFVFPFNNTSEYKQSEFDGFVHHLSFSFDYSFLKMKILTRWQEQRYI
jgi:hypothetical protein